jgi:hypothetical protein
VAVKKCLFLLLLVAACGTPGQPDGNQTQPAAKSGPEATPLETRAAPAAPAGLTGLYEGARTAQTDQLCMIGGADQGRFGTIVWGSAEHSCLGAGRAVRRGDKLILTMSGDSACEIDARIAGDTIEFPAAVSPGCSYYCGARAGFAGAKFTRKGFAKADALKAKDLVGDPLCGEFSR